jgi:hypothetical protein
MLRTATIQEIETHLIELGMGNHSDNIACIRGFPRHYFLDLTEHEFMNLVFLQTSTVYKIAPPHQDRRLKIVAQRASGLSVDDTNLGPNWNIAEVIGRFKNITSDEEGCHLPALLLRDTKNSERKWSQDGWYIQDGSHRALAYCMSLLAGEKEYSPQTAFCATNRQLI